MSHPAPLAHATTTLRVRGLDLALHTWEPPAGVPASELEVLLLHGFADCAPSFDLFASALARRGFRVTAPDQRGFGDSSWVGAGGYYHFPDYVADVEELVRLLAPSRLALVGHSMGGTVASMWAGLRSDRLEKLVLAEGLGPAAHGPEIVPDRFDRWLRDLELWTARPEHRSFGSLDVAAERLAATHTNLDPALLRDRVRHLVRSREDGRVVWKFDPLHRTTAPMPFLPEAYRAFLERIACPVLVVDGGPGGYHPLDEAEREASLRDVQKVVLGAAGHMMHWTEPEPFADAVASFLAG